MISDEELATTAKEGAHWHSITMQIAAELLQLREEKRKADEERAALSAVYEHYKGAHMRGIFTRGRLSGRRNDE